MGQLFVPPTAVTPLYFFLSNDLDGNGSLNNLYTGEVPKITTVTNKGGTGGNLTGLTGSSLHRSPVLRRNTNCGDNPAIQFNGSYDYLTAVGSASVLKQWHVTGGQGELFILFRTFDPRQFISIFGSGEGGTENNVELYVHSNMTLHWVVKSTSGSVIDIASPAIKRGNLYLFNAHFNGTAAKISLNGGATENSGTRANTVADSNMARDFMAGCSVVSGSPGIGAQELFFIWAAATELSAGERLAFYTLAQQCYGNMVA